MVGAHGGRAHIDADALPRFLDVPVEQPEQGHLGFHASLEKVPHVRSAEIAFPFLQFIECRMDGQQQFLDFALVSTASRLFPSKRFSRTFHSLGVTRAWC